MQKLYKKTACSLATVASTLTISFELSIRDSDKERGLKGILSR